MNVQLRFVLALLLSAAPQDCGTASASETTGNVESITWIFETPSGRITRSGLSVPVPCSATWWTGIVRYSAGPGTRNVVLVVPVRILAPTPTRTPYRGPMSYCGRSVSLGGFSFEECYLCDPTTREQIGPAVFCASVPCGAVPCSLGMTPSATATRTPTPTKTRTPTPTPPRDEVQIEVIVKTGGGIYSLAGTASRVTPTPPAP